MLRVNLATSGSAWHRGSSSAEPAWHRRDRAKRQQARQLLRVAQGAQALLDHHGTARMVPSPPAGGKDDWWCHRAGCGKEKVTFGSKSHCHFCGTSKGSCCGGKAEGRPSGGVRSTAQKQLIQQKKDEQARAKSNKAKGKAAGTKAFEKKLEQLQAKCDQQDAKVKQLELAAAGVAAPEPPAAAEAAGPQLKTLRAAREHMLGLPGVDEADPSVLQLDARIAAAAERLDAAQPGSKRISKVEQRVKKGGGGGRGCRDQPGQAAAGL